MRLCCTAQANLNYTLWLLKPSLPLLVAREQKHLHETRITCSTTKRCNLHRCVNSELHTHTILCILEGELVLPRICLSSAVNLLFSRPLQSLNRQDDDEQHLLALLL